MMNGKRHQKLKSILVSSKLHRYTSHFLKLSVLILLATMVLSQEKYKEPRYTVIQTHGNIEIRDYGEYVVAKTTVPIKYKESESNMFRVLASYIFGENQTNEKIPMTAPVTTFSYNDSHSMLFYMLNSDSINDLPKPSGQDITFEKFDLGRCAVISFSWFVNEKRIVKYQNKLKKFLDTNKYLHEEQILVNRYDSPWKLPFMRRNEILIQLK